LERATQTTAPSRRMFLVTEADAAAIRTIFQQRGGAADVEPD
jgi:hypothetical protein